MFVDRCIMCVVCRSLRLVVMVCVLLAAVFCSCFGACCRLLFVVCLFVCFSFVCLSLMCVLIAVRCCCLLLLYNG